MLLTYAVYAVFMSVVFLVAYLYQKHKTNYTMYLLRMPLEEIKVYRDLLAWEEKFCELRKRSDLAVYPNLKTRLEDVSEFLDRCDLKVDLNRILIIEAENIKSDETECSAILQEIRSAPADIQHLFYEKIEILIRIVRLQTRRISRYIKQNRLKMKLLMFLVRVLEVLVKITPSKSSILERIERYNSSKEILKFRESCVMI